MKDSNWAETFTVVGSGASLVAGVATTLVSAARVFDPTVSSSFVSLVGLGGLGVGLVASYLARDRILRKVESDAKLLGPEN